LTTGFSILGSNKALQEHWIKRLIAAIIDGIIIYIPLFIIFNVIFWSAIWGAGWYWWGWWWWLVDGLVVFLYFVLLETTMHASFGKKVFNLQVVTTTGQPLGFGAVATRNVFKIIYPLILLDLLLGLATDGDPRQRYTDRVAHTTVTRTDAQAYVEEQFRQMQYVPPHPHVPPGAWGQPQPQPGQQPYQQYPPQGAAQQAPPPGGWPQGQQGAWSPGAAPPQGQWPQHQWDEKGQLKPPVRFCSSCGGELAPRGDGKMACVRCGLVY